VLSTTHLECQQDIVYTCLKSLNQLLKLSQPRQEQLVLAGGVPYLKESLKYGKLCEEYSVNLLQCLPTASNYCSKVLHTFDIFSLLISYLSKYPRILDGLTKWVAFDKKNCTTEILKNQNIETLIELFSTTPNFDHLLQSFITILTTSEALIAEFSRNDKFLSRLMKESSKVSQPQQLKNCLNLLLMICSKHSKPRDLLDEYQMYSVIMGILHQSHDKDLLILEEIATMLLQVYSKSR
jgi:hypothetical protein